MVCGSAIAAARNALLRVSMASFPELGSPSFNECFFEPILVYGFQN